MRLLVLSDSHGDEHSLSLAISKNPEADAIIFLGDGLADILRAKDKIKNKMLTIVRGNCDYTFEDYPLLAVEPFANNLVYCTHGHSEKVKFTYEILKEKAREKNAAVALFGHTHMPYTEYEDGLYLLNPGSVKNNSCGIVDITDSGIICYTKAIIPNM